MAVAHRGEFRFETFIYVPVHRRKGGEGAKRYVGTFRYREDAERAEREAKSAEYLYVRPRAPKWGVQHKGERECRNCSEPATRLHHIVPRASVKDRYLWNSPLHNGLPLCGNCHMGWHHKALTIHRERLHPEEQAFAMKMMGPAWLDVNYPAEHLHRQDINEAMLDELAQLRDENRRFKLRILELEDRPPPEKGPMKASLNDPFKVEKGTPVHSMRTGDWTPAGRAMTVYPYGVDHIDNGRWLIVRWAGTGGYWRRVIFDNEAGEFVAHWPGAEQAA